VFNTRPRGPRAYLAPPRRRVELILRASGALAAALALAVVLALAAVLVRLAVALAFAGVLALASMLGRSGRRISRSGRRGRCGRSGRRRSGRRGIAPATAGCSDQDSTNGCCDQRMRNFHDDLVRLTCTARPACRGLPSQYAAEATPFRGPSHVSGGEGVLSLRPSQSLSFGVVIARRREASSARSSKTTLPPALTSTPSRFHRAARSTVPGARPISR
jgi:hypothetical protein